MTEYVDCLCADANFVKLHAAQDEGEVLINHAEARSSTTDSIYVGHRTDAAKFSGKFAKVRAARAENRTWRGPAPDHRLRQLTIERLNLPPGFI
jgi:hypothetical protein